MANAMLYPPNSTGQTYRWLQFYLICIIGLVNPIVATVQMTPIIAKDIPSYPAAEVNTSRLSFNLTDSGIRLNPRYAVVFNGEGKLDNAQDYIDHHIVIPIQYKIKQPPVFPPCDATKEGNLAHRDPGSDAYVGFCELSASLNESLWTTHSRFVTQMEDLFNDMKLMLTPYEGESHHPRSRQKRGVLKGLACLLEALFGGCDMGGGAEAKAVRRAFMRLNKRVSGLSSEIENVNGRLISISKMNIEGFKNVDRKFDFVKEGMEGLAMVQTKLRSGFNNLTRAMSTIGENFKQQTDLMLEAIKWTTLMFEWRDQIESAYILIDAITEMERGYIPANLIPPRALRLSLEYLSKQLDKSSARLTYPNNMLSIYYRSPMVRAVYAGEDRIIVALRIPISHVDMEFQLWSVTYGQMSIDDQGTVMQIQPGSDIIGVNFDRSQYILLSRKQLSICEGDKFKRCPTLFPVIPSSKLTCEIALFTMQPHSVVSRECQIIVHQNRNPVQSFDLGGGHWFMAAVAPDWRLFCKDRAPIPVETCSQCVIRLPCGCGLSMTGQSIPIRHHDCRVRHFEAYYSFNPFAFISMPNITDKFHPGQLFIKPLDVPQIPLLKNIREYFNADLSASNSITLNFTKFIEEIVATGTHFSTFDRLMEKEVAVAIAGIRNSGFMNSWYAFGLFCGEVILFCLMLYLYAKSGTSNPIISALSNASSCFSSERNNREQLPYIPASYRSNSSSSTATMLSRDCSDIYGVRIRPNGSPVDFKQVALRNGTPVVTEICENPIQDQYLNPIVHDNKHMSYFAGLNKRFSSLFNRKSNTPTDQKPDLHKSSSEPAKPSDTKAERPALEKQFSDLSQWMQESGNLP